MTLETGNHNGCVNFDQLYREVAFFSINGQSTVYNLSAVPSQDQIESDREFQNHDLIVGTLISALDNSPSARCCHQFSMRSENGKLETVSTRLDFMYLPIADIVCSDAFFDYHTRQYVVGLGLVKEDGASFFNIYSAKTLTELPGRCISHSELGNCPLHATHTYYMSPSTKRLQWALLLSCSAAASEIGSGGGLGPIQVFTRLQDGDCLQPAEDEAKSQSSNSTASTRVSVGGVNSVFGEIDTPSALILFPELKSVPQDADPPFRLSAFGTLDGWIAVGLVNVTTLEVISFLCVQQDFVITQLQYFRPNDINPASHEDYSILVCSAHEPTVIYRNPFRHKVLSLVERDVLLGSDDFDQVNCACVGDLDCDGQPEIVLGTFGSRLLFYKKLQDGGTSYELVHARTMPGPVHRVLFGSYDSCPDGVGAKNLAVLTTHGVHLLRCDLAFCLAMLHRRLDDLISEGCDILLSNKLSMN